MLSGFVPLDQWLKKPPPSPTCHLVKQMHWVSSSSIKGKHGASAKNSYRAFLWTEHRLKLDWDGKTTMAIIIKYVLQLLYHFPILPQTMDFWSIPLLIHGGGGAGGLLGAGGACPSGNLIWIDGVDLGLSCYPPGWTGRVCLVRGLQVIYLHLSILKLVWLYKVWKPIWCFQWKRRSY